jgi:type IV pilus assembly protein PilA
MTLFTSIKRSEQRGQAGFTLIELLVVILIIGILAAIALPAFLGQRAKAQDARAKSNARNMASQIEACWHNDDGYVGCSAELTTAATGLSIGSGPDEVSIVDETPTGYSIQAVSIADTGGGLHTFEIVHNIGGVFERRCSPAGQGGCRADGSW